MMSLSLSIAISASSSTVMVKSSNLSSTTCFGFDSRSIWDRFGIDSESIGSIWDPVRVLFETVWQTQIMVGQCWDLFRVGPLRAWTGASKPGASPPARSSIASACDYNLPASLGPSSTPTLLNPCLQHKLQGTQLNVTFPLLCSPSNIVLFCFVALR